jgi:amino acid permease
MSFIFYIYVFEYNYKNLIRSWHMQNPFETGHIKNYILLYVSVVVIMILFFIATTLFHDVSEVEQKVFDMDKESAKLVDKREQSVEQNSTQSKFKLLEKAY